MKRPGKKDPRADAQIREHYDVEKELADKLRNAPQAARSTLYRALYDELFRRVPHHTTLTRKVSPEHRRKTLAWQLKLLSGFLNKDVTFLEVGPGDCVLSFEVAKFVKKVYGVDVSETITSTAKTPENFQLILSDGFSIHVPKDSIDVVYSNQLMEHLHPNDVVGQLKNILEALSPGGAYLCVTPNRLSGPHDISSSFDSVATGFHLREYTVTELSGLFRTVGFSKIVLYIGGRGVYWRCPVLPAMWCESVLQILPTRLRRAIAGSLLVRGFIGVRLLGIKGSAEATAR